MIQEQMRAMDETSPDYDLKAQQLSSDRGPYTQIILSEGWSTCFWHPHC